MCKKNKKMQSLDELYEVLAQGLLFIKTGVSESTIFGASEM